MQVGCDTGRLSDAARRRFVADEGRMFFVSDWLDVVMLHYEVDPDVLRRDVPFELDLFDGRAFVSLVAFNMSGLRTSVMGRVGRRMLWPIGSHGFLNVRTYVRARKETGIYFLAEFLPNRLSVALGPVAYGLPYRFGRLDYEHDAKSGVLEGVVRAGRPAGTLHYRAAVAPCVGARCEHGASSVGMDAAAALTDFLMERYTAFTRWAGIVRRFRIWHPPWPQQSVAIEVLDDSLLTTTGDWSRAATVKSAHYSPGFRGVWMGRPRLLGHAVNSVSRGGAGRRTRCPA